jgi:hypothetical protein
VLPCTDGTGGRSIANIVSGVEQVSLGGISHHNDSKLLVKLQAFKAAVKERSTFGVDLTCSGFFSTSWERQDKLRIRTRAR